jgi:hypothetical protein
MEQEKEARLKMEKGMKGRPLSLLGACGGGRACKGKS